MRGDPDLTRAVRLVNFNLFDVPGDRKDVPNYLILLARSMGSRDSVEAINDLKAKGTKVIGVGKFVSGLVENSYFITKNT